MIGSFTFNDGIKIKADYKLLNKTFFEWYSSETTSFKLKCVFTQDNTLHSTKLLPTLPKRFQDTKFIEWPPVFLDKKTTFDSLLKEMYMRMKINNQGSLGRNKKNYCKLKQCKSFNLNAGTME